MNSNRLVRLKSRPRGMATRENFILDTEPVPSLRPDGGIDAYPDVLNLLYTGGNFGTLVLAI